MRWSLPLPLVGALVTSPALIVSLTRTWTVRLPQIATAALVISLSSTPPASADIIAFEARGVVTSSVDSGAAGMPLADVVPVGTDILWSIAYDTSWVNPHGCCTFPGGDVFYESDPLWWSITVGDYTAVNGLYHAMSIVGGTETRVQMDGSLSTFGLFGNPPVPGSTWSPMALDAAADITTQSGSFQLYWSYTAPGQSPPGPHGYMRGTFTDVRAVPEPSVLLLAALGASLIGVRHARLIRRRHQTSTTTH